MCPPRRTTQVDGEFRTLPAHADPTTGYTIRVDGQTMVIGGTSAVAPLWAGLVLPGRINNSGTKVGFLQPTIYATKAAAGFNAATQGNNGAFSARSGWGTPARVWGLLVRTS